MGVLSLIHFGRDLGRRVGLVMGAATAGLLFVVFPTGTITLVADTVTRSLMGRETNAY